MLVQIKNPIKTQNPIKPQKTRRVGLKKRFFLNPEEWWSMSGRSREWEHGVA